MSSAELELKTLSPSDAATLADSLWARVKSDERGLVLCAVIDREGQDLRMVGYMNRDSLAATFERGKVVFFSRSKSRLWEKGESSGNALVLEEMRIDCDGDALCCVVQALGPTCHTGARSCFFRRVSLDAPSEGEAALRFDDGPERLKKGSSSSAAATQAPSPGDSSEILHRVFAQIEARKRGEGSTNAEGKSYVKSLIDKGIPKINSKIAEEGAELCVALSRETDAQVAAEAADLIFHAMVGLSARGVAFEDVEAVFRKRFGTSGIDEKASRERNAQG